MSDTGSTRIEVIAEQISAGDVARPMPGKDAQQSFADEYARSGSIARAAEVANISYPTAKKWSQDPRFVATVFKMRQTWLSGEVAGLAAHVMVEIMTAKAPISTDGYSSGPDPYLYPVAVRAKVAGDLLRLGGHTEAAAAASLEGQRVASLGDMTEDQLAAHIAEAQRLLTALPSQGDPPAEAPNPPDVASLL